MKKLFFLLLPVMVLSCKDKGTETEKPAAPIAASPAVPQQEPLQPAADGWITYSKDDYSVSFPKLWHLDTSGKNGTTFAVMAPEPSHKEKFRLNFNLTVQDVSAYDLDFDKFGKTAVGDLQRMSKNMVILENKKITKDGKDCLHVVYLADGANLRLEYEIYAWLVAKKAYVLIFAAEKPKYDAFKATIAQIADRFSIKG